MTWRILTILTLMLSACGPANQSAGFRAPERLTPDWTLRSSGPVPAGSAPAQYRQLGLRRAVRAEYAGAAPLTVTAYEMTTGAGAFEAMQQWRPAPGRLALYHEVWFVVLEASGVETPVLAAAADDIDQALREGD